jgi:NAD+ kinase
VPVLSASVVAHPQPLRIALVVHPTRPVDASLETVQRWAADRGLEIVQIRTPGATERDIAPDGQVEPGDLVVALGGDGTVLSALRASAHASAPVLGVACGSLGALTAVPADEVDSALERVHAGDWTARHLPALSIDPADAPHEWAVNDFVVVRRGAGQVVVELSVDDELYVRLAGDGLIIATPIGSSAYSMAAGGPVVVAGNPAVVCTPLAMHGGNAPPLVVPATSTLRVAVHPSFGGFEIEIDGHAQAVDALEYRVSMHDDKVTLVAFGELGLGLTALRERGLVSDSPRILVRDRRTARVAPDH